jgi:hypothetical protein
MWRNRLTEVTLKAHILRGSKQEIAERIARISGEVHEAIVFVQEPSSVPAASGERPVEPEDFLAEMCPFTVDATDADDSREAIYTRMEGE